MAAVETITISTVTFSVYGLGNADPLNDATEYLVGKIGSTWTTYTDDEKKQALVSAARLIDRSLPWSGSKTAAAQPREWPKDGAQNGCTGEAVPDGTTPDDIAYGEFELAQLLLDDNDILDSADQGSNVRRVKAGSAEVEYFTGTAGQFDLTTRLPQAVQDLVGCYVDGSVLPSSGTLSSGTGDTSFFQDPDSDDLTDWNRSRSF